MKLVVIESPYAGDVEANILYARQCVRHSLLLNEAPIASHLLHTQEGILRDEVEVERLMGIRAGHAWMKFASIVAVYTDRGISPGMERGIDAAHKFFVPVEYRTLG